MKKLLLASIISGLASVAAADSFQDFNNNLYAQYQYVGNNGAQPATDLSQWGVGGTFQSKNNVWLNANALAGDNNGDNSSNLNFAVGYAFQFFGDEASGFQVIPYATYTYGTSLGALNQYYGLGVKPEYRLLNALKVSVDMTAYNATQAGGGAVPAGV
ncbi:MAG TPA: hypothetical protein DHV02_04470, partial [Neisseriales bacterium]|nr:hypothetical protein [Neisseriales bacterium]